MAVIASMTGFGHGSASKGRVGADVALRTVNHRTLDIRWAGNELAPSLEADATEVLRQALRRGRVDARVVVRIKPSADDEAWGAIDDLMDRMKAAAHRYALLDGPTLSDLASAGAFASRGSSPADAGEIRETVLAALDVAVEELLATRRREGRALKADFDEKLSSYAAFLDEVELRVPALREALGERLRSRIATAVASLGEGSASVPAERVMSELALLVERADIAEELTRARLHVQAVATMLAEGGAIGRRLELLAQELIRETNTMAAKSPDASLTQRVLDARLQIEQLKEQAANVE